MTIEVATYISDLDPANPKGTDQRSTGDDHIRLCKQVWINTFPNLTAPVSATAGELNFCIGLTATAQTQLDSKLDLSATASAADRWGDSVRYISTTTPTVVTNGLWFKQEL